MPHDVQYRIGWVFVLIFGSVLGLISLFAIFVTEFKTHVYGTSIVYFPHATGSISWVPGNYAPKYTLVQMTISLINQNFYFLLVCLRLGFRS